MADVDLVRGAAQFVALIVSLSVHEWAHAYTAWKLGDPTAERHGRLTLNPVAHVDPIGSVVLPLLMIFTSIPLLFGYAKPVPVDPTRFRRGVSTSAGMLITSVAGPLSNLLLAFLAALVIRVFEANGGVNERVYDSVWDIFIYLNLLLAIFNMLPVPPLDGHRILPDRVQYALAPHSRLIFMGLIVALWGTPLGGVLYRMIMVAQAGLKDLANSLI